VEFGNHHGHGVSLSLDMAIARRAGEADRRATGGEDSPAGAPLQAETAAESPEGRGGRPARIFPMIGNFFSNGWKIWPDFSNDWKNFSRFFQ
jgi:hypothetical protein